MSGVGAAVDVGQTRRMRRMGVERRDPNLIADRESLTGGGGGGVYVNVVKKGGRWWSDRLVTVLVMVIGVCAGARAEGPPREPRMIFTTSSHTSTTTVPGPNRLTTVDTTPSTPATTINGVGFFQFFEQFPNSAISYNGQSYFVNYNKPTGTLPYVAELCYLDPTCISFDYSQSQGWMHRVTKNCAASVGGSFIDGSDSDGSVYFQLLPSVLAQKGINTSECWQPAGQSKSTFDRAKLVGQVFGTTAVVLGVALLLTAFAFFVVSRKRRRQRIADVIDANAPLDDGQDVAEVRAVRNNDARDAVAEDQLLAPA
eukprot:m.86696 g.86696  ORF g.86696 m.86696 type:complete len:313 (-) comp19857_c0_seq1:2928-3866(-)